MTPHKKDKTGHNYHPVPLDSTHELASKSAAYQIWLSGMGKLYISGWGNGCGKPREIK